MTNDTSHPTPWRKALEAAVAHFEREIADDPTMVDSDFGEAYQLCKEALSEKGTSGTITEYHPGYTFIRDAPPQMPNEAASDRGDPSDFGTPASLAIFNKSSDKNGKSSKHPHEPAIPPTLDAEGRCLVCAMSVRIGQLERELADEKHRVARAAALLVEAQSHSSARVATAKNAERYRWLHNGDVDGLLIMKGHVDDAADIAALVDGEELDRLVDEAIARSTSYVNSLSSTEKK